MEAETVASGGLVRAAMRNDLDAVRRELASEWVQTHGAAGSWQGRTGLEAAVERGHTSVAKLLLEHPSVGDAIVFGLPHPRFGEAVSAMVAPAEGAEIDGAELLEFVAARLAGFKKPRHLFVRETLGRSITGKVELARVKEDALRELQEANA